MSNDKHQNKLENIRSELESIAARQKQFAKELYERYSELYPEGDWSALRPDEDYQDDLIQQANDIIANHWDV